MTKRVLIQRALCPLVNCPYNVEGVCDDVETNRGNSDARCRRLLIEDVRHLARPYKGPECKVL